MRQLDQHKKFTNNFVFKHPFVSIKAAKRENLLNENVRLIYKCEC